MFNAIFTSPRQKKTPLPAGKDVFKIHVF